MRNNFLLVLITILGLLLSSCGNTSGSSSSNKPGLPPEAEAAIKEELTKAQKDLSLKPLANEEVKIINLMKSPSKETGYDEVWCANISPALSSTEGLGGGDDLMSKCSKETPCKFNPNNMINNIIIVRTGALWSMGYFGFVASNGPVEEQFLSFGCTNWIPEYDISDRAY